MALQRKIGSKYIRRDPGTTRRSVQFSPNPEAMEAGAGLIPEESVNSKLRREIKPTTTY